MAFEFNFEEIKLKLEEDEFMEVVKQIETNETFNDVLKEKENTKESFKHDFRKPLIEDDKEYQVRIITLGFKFVNEVVEVSFIDRETYK